MRTVYHTLLFVLVFFLGQSLHAQTSGNKAKEFYVQAENAYRVKDYSKSLDLLNQVQNSLGSNNAMIESLRAKNYFEQGEYQKTKSSLDVFFSFSNTAENLLTEMYGLLEKTDTKIKEAQERKIAEQQKAIRDEQARVEKESQEKKDYQDAMEANSVYQYNRFISSYPNSQYLSDIKERHGYAYVAEGEAYTSAKNYKSAIKLYDEYLKKFPNGNTIGRVKTNLAEVYYLLGEVERNNGNHTLAESYYNEAVDIKVNSTYSKYYEQVKARLKEYKNARLQLQKDNLMAEAMKNKSYADGYYSNQKLFLYSGIGFALPGLGLLGWGISQKFKGGSLVGGILGPAMLIGGTVLLSKAPKQKKKGDKYYQDYLNYKKQADGIKLSFAPIVAPNQTYGLALRIEF